MPAPPTTDPFDFDRYLARVGLDRASVAEMAPRSYALLHHVMWAQATHIPWENLSNAEGAFPRVLHPRNARAVADVERDVSVKVRTSIDPDDIYEKLVVANRGGFCYEHNLLLARALRELGFDVMPIGARGVNRDAGPGLEKPGEPAIGFPTQASTHLVLVATTDDGVRYLVDDGYVWGGAPRAPLALVHGQETVDENTGEIHRLVRGPAKPHARSGYEKWGPFALHSGPPGETAKTDQASRAETDGFSDPALRRAETDSWFLQYKPSREAAGFWDLFHFDTRSPTTLTDCQTGAWFASCSPYHRHPHLRLAARMTDDGRVSLVNDLLTIRRGGRVVEERTLATAEDFADALAHHFGLRAT